MGYQRSKKIYVSQRQNLQTNYKKINQLIKIEKQKKLKKYRNNRSFENN